MRTRSPIVFVLKYLLPLFLLGSICTSSAASFPIPDGDLTDLYMEPGVVVISDPINDEPLNPDGKPTGFNMQNIAICWGPDRDTLWVGQDMVTCSWDGDGDGDWRTTPWPWNPAPNCDPNMPACFSLPEEGTDITDTFYWGSHYERYSVQIKTTGGAYIGLWWVKDGPYFPPMTNCNIVISGVGGKMQRQKTYWSFGYPPRFPDNVDLEYVAEGLRDFFGDKLNGDTIVSANSLYSVRWWREHEDWVPEFTIFEKPPL